MHQNNLAPDGALTRLISNKYTCCSGMLRYSLLRFRTCGEEDLEMSKRKQA